jgi:hypothetical protein
MAPTFPLAASAPDLLPAAEEPLVVAHQQVGLHLADGVQRHADDDQEAGPAEIERDVEPADEIVGKDGDQGEEERPG